MLYKAGDTWPGLPSELVFVQGEAPDTSGTPPTKALLVECWASWCPPCKANIPHVQKFWEEYREKGLKIVAVAVRESGDVEEIQERIAKLIKIWTLSKMTYPVAIDVPGPGEDGTDGIFADAFLAKGKVRASIPFCFLVNAKNEIVYVGKPELILDRVEKVINGEL